MSYTQYIRDTRRAWAAMPKPELLNETIDLASAAQMIDALSGNPASARQNHIDLVSGQVVYLQDGTCLKVAGSGDARHWE